MATPSLTARIAITGGKEALADLKALGAGGEVAFKKLKDGVDAVNAGGGLLSKLSLNVATLRAGFIGLAPALASAQKGAAGFTTAIAATIGAVSSLRGGLIAVGAAVGAG